MSHPDMVRIWSPEPHGESWDAGVNAGTTKASQSHGIRCELPVCAAVCQVRMLALNKSAKTGGLNGAPALIFLPGVMEETQLALVEHWWRQDPS